jgi:predicted DNA-binding transcriptional regulator YafY
VRADRLLSILMLLQARGRMTARALAGALEVSERTIHRDMEALGASGVPVVADRGARGGWRLLEGWRTDLTGLAEDEVRALFVPPPDRILADLGLGGGARAAATKLLAALPAGQRAAAAGFRDRVHVDTSTWREPGETVAAFKLIQDAVWRACRLAVAYRRGDGTAVARTLEPLGLVAKGAAWYVVARCDGELRTYRVDRVTRAEVLDEPFERPAGFDLAAFWAGSTSDFVAKLPEFRLEGRVAPDLLPALPYVGRFSRVEHVDPPGADGWSRVRVRVQTEEEAIAYALGLAPRFELLEPSELRPRVAARARAAAALYDHTSPRGDDHPPPSGNDRPPGMRGP